LLNFPKQIWWLGSLYVVSSISVCIYIGWASCMEVFLAILAGLVSGHILFKSLYNQEKVRVSIVIVLGSLVFGVVSLFIYQTVFGIFLIPFFVQYVQRKKAKPDRIVIIGIIIIMPQLMYFVEIGIICKKNLEINKKE